MVHGKMGMLRKQSLTHTYACRRTHVDTLCKVYAKVENSHVSGISMVEWHNKGKCI